MRAAVCFLYVGTLFIYFVFDFGKYWGDVYLQSQCLMVGYLASVLSVQRSFKEYERLLFKFVSYIAFTDAAYTLVCMFKGSDFAIYNTNVFAYIIGISLVVLLVHIAVNKDKFK